MSMLKLPLEAHTNIRVWQAFHGLLTMGPGIGEKKKSNLMMRLRLPEKNPINMCEEFIEFKQLSMLLWVL